MASSSSSARMSRDEYKKAKELEEARKAGTAPAEVDEDGKEINPHIPQYIAQAPWYLNNDRPSLKHQRAFLLKNDYTRDWYQRGVRAGPASTKFRKGACTNCGAMSHKAKDCCERPRKVGAKFTGKDIQADEVTKELFLDFDGKRDRWNGFEPEEYDHVVIEFDRAEQLRRQRKKEEELQKFSMKEDGKINGNGHGIESDSEDSDVEGSGVGSGIGPEDEKADFIDKDEKAVGVKKDPRTRTTIRNLRIREDTAKYLRNLDPNSSYYDPKSRSMRENPYQASKADEQVYTGDNAQRHTGDVQKFAEIQLYSFEAFEKGQNIHLQAAPSQAELLFKTFNEKKESLTNKHREEIFQRYGGQEHLEAPPKSLLLAQTEEFVEYTPEGNLLHDRHKVIPRSKYEEDIFINNHTAIWGSYWEDGKWGFACCHQLLKNSYCTGQAGIEAKEELKRDLLNLKQQTSLVEQFQSNKKGTSAEYTEKGEEKEHQLRLEKALKEEDLRRTMPEEKDERKRAYNSLSKDVFEVTEEDMEAYHLKRIRSEDPMAKFLAFKA